MKKYAVISTDDNPDYYSLVPITCYSWKKLGYIPIVIQVIDLGKENTYKKFIQFCDDAIIHPISSVKGIKDSTTAQVSRLFAGCLPYINNDDIIVSGDCDMVIAKDIFANTQLISSYGFDLTGRSELPICYVYATKNKWQELMKISSDTYIEKEIKNNVSEKAYSDKWEDYWSVDQQLLTLRAKEYGFENILFVDRGHDQSNHGLPKGRWDRYKWENIPSEIIDVHMIRHPLNNWDKIIEMCKYLWPNDDLSWVENLGKELKK